MYFAPSPRRQLEEWIQNEPRSDSDSDVVSETHRRDHRESGNQLRIVVEVYFQNWCDHHRAHDDQRGRIRGCRYRRKEETILRTFYPAANASAAECLRGVIAIVVWYTIPAAGRE